MWLAFKKDHSQPWSVLFELQLIASIYTSSTMNYDYASTAWLLLLFVSSMNSRNRSRGSKWWILFVCLKCLTTSSCLHLGIKNWSSLQTFWTNPSSHPLVIAINNTVNKSHHLTNPNPGCNPQKHSIEGVWCSIDSSYWLHLTQNELS